MIAGQCRAVGRIGRQPFFQQLFLRKVPVGTGCHAAFLFGAPLSFVVANLLILWSGWDTVWRLGVAILIGYVILAATRIFRWNPRSPQLDLRAASWLPFYLVGMGAIVYLSDFGPTTHQFFGNLGPTPNWFPLWWDMVAVAIFCLIIYAWAIAVALPTERIEGMIGEVVLPEEADIASEPLTREVV